MDINQAPAETGHHGRRDPLQVPGEDHEPRVAHGGENLVGVRGIGEHRDGHARPARPLERRRVRAARDDAGDARDVGAAQPLEQRLEVRPAARDEDRDGEWGEARRGSAQRSRLQGDRDLGFEPAVTLSVNAPVASLFDVFTTTK